MVTLRMKFYIQLNLLLRPPLVSDHVSSATSFLNTKIFPSQITIYGTSCKRPPLVSDLFLTIVSDHLTRCGLSSRKGSGLTFWVVFTESSTVLYQKHIIGHMLLITYKDVKKYESRSARCGVHRTKESAPLLNNLNARTIRFHDYPGQEWFKPPPSRSPSSLPIPSRSPYSSTIPSPCPFPSSSLI